MVLILILIPIQISKDAGQVSVQKQQFTVAVEVLDELRVVDEAEVVLVEQLLGVGDEVDEVADATVEGDAVLTHVVVAHVVSLDELTTEGAVKKLLLLLCSASEDVGRESVLGLVVATIGSAVVDPVGDGIHCSPCIGAEL